ncbi:MAG: hypothetical protein ABIJ16_09485 [Bacteroidota bacterium]
MMRNKLIVLTGIGRAFVSLISGFINKGTPGGGHFSIQVIRGCRKWGEGPAPVSNTIYYLCV